MKTLIAILLLSAATAYGAVVQNPFVSNSASAYPSGGQVPVWGGTAWTFGSGGSATNLSPWSEDINAANYSLTNASTVSATNITGDSTIARTNANHFALSVTNNSANAVTFRGGINLIDATVTATMVPDSQSVILEPAGSGNLPDFLFGTNGNFTLPGKVINGFGRTLMDTVDVTNAIRTVLVAGADGSGLTNIPSSAIIGGGGSATNVYLAAGTNIIVATNGPGDWTVSATGFIPINGGVASNLIVYEAGVGTMSFASDARTLNYDDGTLAYLWNSGTFYRHTNNVVFVLPTNAFSPGEIIVSQGTDTVWTNQLPTSLLPSTWSLTTLNVDTLNVTNPPYLNATNMTNGPWVLKAGDTATGPILTTSSTTNGPAQTELVTAQWVRSLLSGGFQYYAGTNVFTGATNADTAGQPVYAFEPNIPSPPASRAYVNPTAGTYLGAVMITNKLLFVDSPISVNAYMTLSSGGGDAATVHAELYYSYDGTNWLGDFVGPSFAMTAGATRLYQWTISFPAITSTNGSGFYIQRRFKIDSKGGTPTITFLVGTNTTSGPNTASHISLAGPTSAAGNAYLAFNQTFTGSNVFTASTVFSNGAIIYGSSGGTNYTYTDSTGWHNTNSIAANNGVDISRGKVTAQQGFYGDSAGTTNATATYATNNSPNCLVFDAQLAKQLVITNASFSMVGFSNTVAGRLHSISICVSNSGSAITVTGPGAVRYIGAVSTNALVLAGGKQGYWSFDIWPGVLTNCANVAEQ